MTFIDYLSAGRSEKLNEGSPAERYMIVTECPETTYRLSPRPFRDRPVNIFSMLPANVISHHLLCLCKYTCLIKQMPFPLPILKLSCCGSNVITDVIIEPNFQLAICVCMCVCCLTYAAQQGAHLHFAHNRPTYVIPTPTNTDQP